MLNSSLTRESRTESWTHHFLAVESWARDSTVKVLLVRGGNAWFMKLVEKNESLQVLHLLGFLLGNLIDVFLTENTLHRTKQICRRQGSNNSILPKISPKHTLYTGTHAHTYPDTQHAPTCIHSPGIQIWTKTTYSWTHSHTCTTQPYAYNTTYMQRMHTVHITQKRYMYHMYTQYTTSHMWTRWTQTHACSHRMHCSTACMQGTTVTCMYNSWTQTHMYYVYTQCATSNMRLMRTPPTCSRTHHTNAHMSLVTRNCNNWRHH